MASSFSYQSSLTIPLSVILTNDGARGIRADVTLADGTELKTFWMKGDLERDGADLYFNKVTDECADQLRSSIQNFND